MDSLNDMYIIICIVTAIFVIPYSLALGYLFKLYNELQRQILEKASTAEMKEYVGLRLDTISLQLANLEQTFGRLLESHRNGRDG